MFKYCSSRFWVNDSCCSWLYFPKFNCPYPSVKTNISQFFWFFHPKFSLYQHFIYISIRHSNNFFHKLCSSIVLVGSGLMIHVAFGYTSEKRQMCVCVSQFSLWLRSSFITAVLTYFFHIFSNGFLLPPPRFPVFSPLSGLSSWKWLLNFLAKFFIYR